MEENKAMELDRLMRAYGDDLISDEDLKLIEAFEKAMVFNVK